jgi:hypothetical protein
MYGNFWLGRGCENSLGKYLIQKYKILWEIIKKFIKPNKSKNLLRNINENEKYASNKFFKVRHTEETTRLKMRSRFYRKKGFKVEVGKRGKIIFLHKFQISSLLKYKS